MATVIKIKEKKENPSSGSRVRIAVEDGDMLTITKEEDVMPWAKFRISAPEALILIKHLLNCSAIRQTV